MPDYYIAPPFFFTIPHGGSVRFRLNGQVKTANNPVTGAALWKIAGNPKTLVRAATPVPNDYAFYGLTQDQVLTATY